MNPNETQITNVKNIVVKELDDDTIGEIISVKNIETGETTLANFHELKKFGTEVPRPGRIPFQEIVEKAPQYIELLTNTRGMDEINEGMFDEKLLNTEAFNEIKNEMLEEDEIEEAITYEEARKQIVSLQGLKIDRNLVWDIRKIVRSDKQREYLESQGNDIEFLKKLYSYIPEKKMKRIQKRWNEKWVE